MKKSIEDYRQLANINDLEYLGRTEPDNIRISTQWRCKICNSNMQKSYHTLKYANNACRCRNSLTLKIKDYHSLAERLGIMWLGDYLPINTKTITKWGVRGHSNILFDATYHDLAYRVKSSLKPLVEFRSA